MSIPLTLSRLVGLALLMGSACESKPRTLSSPNVNEDPTSALAARSTVEVVPGQVIREPAQPRADRPEVKSPPVPSLALARTAIAEPNLNDLEKTVEPRPAVSLPPPLRVHDIAGLFATLPKRFQPNAAHGLDAVFQYEFRGAGGGTYHVIVQNEKIEVAKGPAVTPNVTIKATASDFVNFMNGDARGTQALMSGRIAIEGNEALGRRMNSLFPPRPASLPATWANRDAHAQVSIVH